MASGTTASDPAFQGGHCRRPNFRIFGFLGTCGTCRGATGLSCMSAFASALSGATTGSLTVTLRQFPPWPADGSRLPEFPDGCAASSPLHHLRLFGGLACGLLLFSTAAASAAAFAFCALARKRDRRRLPVQAPTTGAAQDQGALRDQGQRNFFLPSPDVASAASAPAVFLHLFINNPAWVLCST